MDVGARQSPDFKPVQLGKRGSGSPGSCGSKFHRLEPAAQTAQTSDIATSPGEPHADAVDERFAATQLSEARARDTCETRTSCLSVPERGIQPTTKLEVLSNRPGGELAKRPISQHHFPPAPVALCIGHVEELQEMECRVLRVVPEVAIPAVVSPEGPTRAQVRSRSIAEAALFEQAAALGFACLPIDKIEKEIAAAMVTRMRTRQGHHIYQSVSHSVLGVPLSLAKRMFPTWRISTWRTATARCGCSAPSMTSERPSHACCRNARATLWWRGCPGRS